MPKLVVLCWSQIGGLFGDLLGVTSSHEVSKPFGGPFCVPKSAVPLGSQFGGPFGGHMVIKLVVHLVSQSLWYLWWYKVGCPFGGPSGLEVSGSFGVPRLMRHFVDHLM